MHLCVELNLPPPGRAVRTASETLKQSLFWPVWGWRWPVGGFSAFWYSCPVSVCLYLHRSSAVGKPDTRKQRAPHSFVVYDGVR